MKNKYNIGDKLVRLSDARIAEFEISGIVVGAKGVFYTDNITDETSYLSSSKLTWRPEKELYKTREELIKNL